MLGEIIRDLNAEDVNGCLIIIPVIITNLIFFSLTYLTFKVRVNENNICEVINIINSIIYKPQYPESHSLKSSNEISVCGAKFIICL